MVRLSPILISITFVVTLTGCKALGQVASGAGHVAVGLGKVAAVTAKVVGPAVAVAAKTAHVAAQVAAPIARAAAPVARAAAPVVRETGHAAKHVAMDAAQLGIGVASEISSDEFDIGYSEETGWVEEAVLLPPPPVTISATPNAPSFFELVRIHVETLQYCFDDDSPNAWASLFFRVELDGSIQHAQIIGGNAARTSQNCLVSMATQLRFPSDSATHGLLVRVTHR